MKQYIQWAFFKYSYISLGRRSHCDVGPTTPQASSTSHCRYRGGDPVPRRSVVWFGGTMAGWWFGTSILFSHILGIIIPIDFHIFQRGSNHQPVKVVPTVWGIRISFCDFLDFLEIVLTFPQEFGGFPHLWRMVSNQDPY